MEKELLSVIQRPIPMGLSVVPGSVPIVFFGDVENAEYAVISINPSFREFECDRILCRTNLNLADSDVLTDVQAQDVYQSFVNYFNKNPYNKWFKPLNNFIKEMYSGADFYSGNMVGLDITPWGTDPVWGNGLTDDQKQGLIDNSGNVLKTILGSKVFKKVFLNGKQSMAQVEKYLGLRPVSELSIKLDKCNRVFKKYNYLGVDIIGWSFYLQDRATTRTEKDACKTLIPSL